MRGFLFASNIQKHLGFIALFIALILPPLALFLMAFKLAQKDTYTASKKFDRFVFVFSLLMLIPFTVFTITVLKTGNFSSQAQAQARPITLEIERNDNNKICSTKSTTTEFQSYKVYYESFKGSSLRGELQNIVNKHSFLINESEAQNLEATNGPSRLAIAIHENTNVTIRCDYRELTKIVSGNSRIIELTMTYRN